MPQSPLKESFRLTIVEDKAQNLFPDLVLEGVVGFGSDLDEDVVVEGLDGSWDADDVLEVVVPAVVEVAGGIGIPAWRGL